MQQRKSSHIFIGNFFDQYACGPGKWAYDNGWRYKGQYFGAAYQGEDFSPPKSATPDYLLMLREGEDPTWTILIHATQAGLTEIWSGPVQCRDDFDKMMDFVQAYATEYKTRLGHS